MNQLENETDEVNEHDRDPSNVMLRSGYLLGLAAKSEGEDRKFLLRASRSLRAFHADLTASPASPGPRSPG